MYEAMGNRGFVARLYFVYIINKGRRLRMAQIDGDKKKIKQLIRKNKYYAYLILGIIGVILIAFAVANNAGKQEIPMGIGTGIVATVIGFIMLLMLLPDENFNDEKIKELEKWGIEKIYPERKNIKIIPKNFPSENLDFIAFGLSHFVKANPTENVVKKIEKGLRVRIIVPHPKARIVSEQQQMENNGSIASDIRRLISWVLDVEEKLKNSTNKKGSIEIKFYDNNPIGFYCRADGKVWAGPYMPGINSGQVITYEFLRHSKGGDYYASIFESIWNEECAQVKLGKSENKYLSGNQEEAIKKVLEYFCGCMQEECKESVIGVVVMFKDDLRRTFFSCNKKHHENHKCHKKSDGLVGAMVKLNQNAKGENISLWRDYKNKITIKHVCLERSVKTIKIEEQIHKFKADETIGIMSVPLMNEDECIGAITFDFAEFGEKYLNDVTEINNLKDGAEVEKKNEILKYFSLAGTCAEIVQKILGQDIKIQYKDLFNENWKESK